MDVVVTVSTRYWDKWLAEGKLSDKKSTQEFGFTVPVKPNIEPGERVYIVAGGRLRGYAPLLRVAHAELLPGTVNKTTRYRGKWALVRSDGAKAVTIPQQIPGFRGYRYRWWDRAEEKVFRGWQKL